MLKRIKNLFKRKNKTKRSVCESIDNLFESLNEEVIVVELGTDLLKYYDLICGIITVLRDEIKDECGFIVPAVKVRSNIFRQENEFCIKIRKIKSEKGYLIPNEEGIREEFYSFFKSVVYNSLDIIFTNEIAEKYINTVQTNNGWLIWNLTNTLSVIDIKTILSDIIKKGKSIGDINYVFEKIGENILSNGEYKDCIKKYNPHKIAKEVVNSL